MDSVELLYIHPQAFPNDLRIPLGVTGIMNNLICSKKGIYSDELTDLAIQSTRIIAMDLHWIFHLRAVEKIARRCKRVNQSIVIIVGGYTATIFAKIIIKKFAIDYIITGDAEKPFSQLVQCILSGGDVREVPNLIARNWQSTDYYTLSEKEFNSLDIITADWFQTYKLRTNVITTGIPYTFIPIARGCFNNCSWCYGNPKLQNLLCKRSLVVRKAEIVSNDFQRLAKDKSTKCVGIISDFFELEKLGFVDSGFTNNIFLQNYDLNVYFEFFNLPSISDIELFANSFKQSTIAISFFSNHGQSLELCNIQAIESLAKKCENLTGVTLLLYGNTDDYAIKYYTQRLQEKYSRLLIADDSNWKTIAPYPVDDVKQLQNQFDFFYSIYYWEKP